MLKKILLMAMVWSLLIGSAWADDIVDEIGRATKTYQAGDIKKAMGMLDGVMGMMNKKRDAYFLSSFPEPLVGWTASEALSNPFAASVLGSGSTMSRIYYKATGERMVLNIMSGSDLVKGASGVINSHLAKLATAKSDQKWDNIRGFKLKTKMKKGKKRVTLLAGTVMVSAESKDVPEEEMRAYLALFPLEKF